MLNSNHCSIVIIQQGFVHTAVPLIIHQTMIMISSYHLKSYITYHLSYHHISPIIIYHLWEKELDCHSSVEACPHSCTPHPHWSTHWSTCSPVHDEEAFTRVANAMRMITLVIKNMFSIFLIVDGNEDNSWKWQLLMTIIEDDNWWRWHWPYHGTCHQERQCISNLRLRCWKLQHQNKRCFHNQTFCLFVIVLLFSLFP